MLDTLSLYETGLGTGDLHARGGDGTLRVLPIERWLAPACRVDERLLARADGPVVDLGCGPGRHVQALTRRGVTAVGVDVSPAAVAMVRRAGAPAIHASIFGALPGAGRWRTALLLDGNIGIGGEPAALLRRTASLLAPNGKVLCELDAPGTGYAIESVRLEAGGSVSSWFSWAHVDEETIVAPAQQAGLSLVQAWEDGGRWFAELRPCRP